jgi:hypothetical protein
MYTKTIFENANELLDAAAPVRAQGDNSPSIHNATLVFEVAPKEGTFTQHAIKVTLKNACHFEYIGNVHDLLESAFRRLGFKVETK